MTIDKPIEDLPLSALGRSLINKIKERKSLSFDEKIQLYLDSPYVMTNETDIDIIFEVIRKNSDAIKYCRVTDTSLEHKIIMILPHTINMLRNISDTGQDTILQVHPSYISHIRNPNEKTQLVLIREIIRTDIDLNWYIKSLFTRTQSKNHYPFIRLLHDGYNLGIYDYERLIELIHLRQEGRFLDDDIEQETLIHKMYL